MASDRSLTYRSSLTGDFLPLFLIIGIGSAALLLVGTWYSEVLGRQWGLPFIALGGAALVMTLAHILVQLRQRVTVTPHGVRYEGAFHRFALAWQEIAEFDVETRGVLKARCARLGDGRRAVRLDSSFFPEFEQMVSLIAVGRRRHRNTWLLVNKPICEPRAQG